MPDAVIPPLEVFILDADFKRLTGSIPYDSLIWHRRYYGVGEFQMQVRSSLYSTDWAYVYCEDRPETGIIQKVEYDDTTEGPRNGEDTVIISGFFLEEVLNRLVFLFSTLVPTEHNVVLRWLAVRPPVQAVLHVRAVHVNVSERIRSRDRR